MFKLEPLNGISMMTVTARRMNTSLKCLLSKNVNFLSL